MRPATWLSFRDLGWTNDCAIIIHSFALSSAQSPRDGNDLRIGNFWNLYSVSGQNLSVSLGQLVVSLLDSRCPSWVSPI